MGVQGHVPSARGAMAEGHRDEPGAGLDRRAPLSAPDEAGVSLHVGDCLGYRIIVRAHDRSADPR